MSLCHLRPAARVCPLAPAFDRPLPSTARCDWTPTPQRSCHPLSANWVFVIAQSVVGLEENEVVKTALWSAAVSDGSMRGDGFRSQSTRCSSWFHYGALWGTGWFRLSNRNDTKAFRIGPWRNTNTQHPVLRAPPGPENGPMQRDGKSMANTHAIHIYRSHTQ